MSAAPRRAACTPSIRVRPADADDAPAFLSVMRGVQMDPRSSWSRATEEEIGWSLGQGGGFLAEQAGEPTGHPVGCVGWRPDGTGTLTLNKLATLPRARGLGLGAALVRAVEGLAAARGYTRVLLAVSRYNLGVLPFYERLGYVQTDEPYAHASTGSPAPVVLVRTLDGRRHEETPCEPA